MNRRRFLRILVVPVVLAGTGLGVAQIAASASRPDWHLTARVQARVPAQHVVPEATGLTADTSKVVPNKREPSQVPVPWNVDGCDHDYGTASLCVPWSVPGTTTAARCNWLLANGFSPFAVYGKDRQDLNPAHTALACSAADLKVGA